MTLPVGVRRDGAARATRLSPKARRTVSSVLWSFLSIGLFAGLWELLWAFGAINPLLLPPPHIFLSDIPHTLTFFDHEARRVGGSGGGNALLGLLTTIGWTTLRVVAGLTIGFCAGVACGALISYVRLFRNLVQPLILMLAPISPVAWLPVAIFVFGIGNAPAIFLVVVTVFFMIVLATVSQIHAVPKNYLHVSRIMGASERQTFWRVILPAILPGLFMTLRLNLFAAWMVVLIAESVGVGIGLGQVTGMARATFNSKLVFFTMVIIGALGFTFDWALRKIQEKTLWWVQPNQGAA
jgi:NitT/TauT family transport system permease protein